LFQEGVEGVRVDESSNNTVNQARRTTPGIEKNNLMQIDETTSSQNHGSSGIRSWVAAAALALGIACATESAYANDRLEIPGDDPGIPAYAQFGIDPVNGAYFILHDDRWAVIPFYREPDCVPKDFNLVEFLDVPACFSCPLTVAGFSLLDPAGMPLFGRSSGPAEGHPFVTIYMVKFDELLAAIADDTLTIVGLQALPSLMIGHADFFEEVIGLGHMTDDGQYTSCHYELTARGTLENNAGTFSIHFTTGGRAGKSAKAYPNLIVAEVRFGK
jgi:hypothetical protein